MRRRILSLPRLAIWLALGDAPTDRRTLVFSLDDTN